MEAIKTGLGIGGGTAGLFALLLAVRRQWHQEGASKAIELDADERRVTELYAQAVEQLGSSEAHVRLGGLYALERLAQSSTPQQQTIVNVICAYLRMPYELPSETREDDSEAYKAAIQEREVRIAAQRILVDHLRAGNERDVAVTFWPDIDVDLKGARLLDFDMRECTVRQVSFEQVRFVGTVNFTRATFTGSARFTQADFQGGAYFGATAFNGLADFADARFREMAYFWSARFKKTTIFSLTNFEIEARFSAAQFASATSFTSTVFHARAQFALAMFTGETDFSLARFRGTANFRSAHFIEATFQGVNFELDTSFYEAKFARGAPIEVKPYISIPPNLHSHTMGNSSDDASFPYIITSKVNERLN